MPGVGKGNPRGERPLRLPNLELTLANERVLVLARVVEVEPERMAAVVFARHPEAERLIVTGTGRVLEELQGVH